METLHLQLSNLKDDLVKDNMALAWFDLSRNLSNKPSTPPQTGFPSSLPSDDPFASFDSSPNSQLRKFFQERFPGKVSSYFVMETNLNLFKTTGGLASPPESQFNSPNVVASTVLGSLPGIFSPSLRDALDF